MNSLIMVLIGIVLGLLLGRYFGRSLAVIWYGFRYWRKENFYSLYRDCLDLSTLELDKEPWFKNIAAHKPSPKQHHQAMENYANQAYEDFRDRQEAVIRLFIITSVICLAILALIVRSHIGWLVASFAATTAGIVWYKIIINGHLGSFTVILYDMVAGAYRQAGVQPKDDTTTIKKSGQATTDTVKQTHATTTDDEWEAVKAFFTRPLTGKAFTKPIFVRKKTNSIGKWYSFRIIWLLFDGLICTLLVSGFWQNDVIRLHYTIPGAIASSIGQIIFIQLFFAPVFFVMKFIVKRRRKKATNKNTEKHPASSK